jgi:peptidoglycan/LPS O-acetylase OafA/YrhL
VRKLSEVESVYLDCLRGVAALTVAIGHGLGSMPSKPLLGGVYAIQSYAVVIFFVLSGFLIAYYAVSRRYTFEEFIIDRWCRIYVAFIPALILTALLDQYTFSDNLRFLADRNGYKAFIGNLLSLQHIPFNRFFSWGPYIKPYGSNEPLWSISTEFWLYMSFGIVFFARSASWLARGLMILLALPSAVVVAFFVTQESLAMTWVVGAIAGIAFYGLAPQAVATTKGLARSATLFFLALLGLRFWTMHPTPYFNFYDIQLMMFSSGAMIASIFWVNESRLLSSFMMATAGLWRYLAWISYSLYLIHQPLQYCYNVKLGVWKSYWELALVVAGCVVLADLFTRAFDARHKDVAKILKSVLLSRLGRRTPRPTAAVLPVRSPAPAE